MSFIERFWALVEKSLNGFSRENEAYGLSRTMHRAALCLCVAVVLGSCVGVRERHVGQEIKPELLQQVTVGATEQEAILALGTPSTESSFENQRVLYYLSETRTTTAFNYQTVSDRKVVAVYLDDEGVITKVANYGLVDGEVFDFVSRRTKSGGEDLTFVKQLLGKLLTF